MCGIVGIIDKFLRLGAPELDRFEEMLILDSLRGKDSTGAFCVYNTGQAYQVKQATHPHNLFETKEWGKFREKAIKSCGIVVGHNRKATIGSITTQNAHPFHEDKIILVHNGGIWNHKTLDKSYESEVDSQVIAKALNKESPSELFPRLSGAFAFVWYDLRDKTLNMFRNKERPLWLAETAMAYWFASEPFAYYVPLGRHGIKPTEQFELKEWTHYKFSTKTRAFSTKEIAQYPKGAPVSNHSFDYSDDGEMVYTNYSGFGTVKREPFLPPTKIAANTVLAEELKKAAAEKKESEPDLATVELRPDGYIKDGEVIIHTVERVQADTHTGRIKFYGKCLTPGRLESDVISMTSMTDLEEAHKYFTKDHKFFISKVKQAAYPVCGPTCWVIETKPVTHTSDFDGNEWPTAILPSIFIKTPANLSGGRCYDCGKETVSSDMPFCRIKKVNAFMKANKYGCTCPDCVEKSLDPEKKHDFIEAYTSTASVQDGKQVIHPASPVLQ